jgi:polo-like kinase 1
MDEKKVEDKAPSTTELAKIQATSATFIQPELLAVKCQQQPRTELVVQFVDFSSKYGLGYKLSNGSFGVLFNDSTKIVTHPNLFHFDYIDRVRGGQSDEKVQHFNFFEFPETINKKVVLLQHFKSYLDGNQKFKPLEFAFTKENAPARPETEFPLSYIKKWKRARKAIVLRSSNKVIQVLFQDQSELVLCSGSGTVAFVNAKRELKSDSVQNE